MILRYGLKQMAPLSGCEDDAKETNDQPREPNSDDTEENKDVSIEDLHAMYYDMFVVGCEAIEEQLTGNN